MLNFGRFFIDIEAKCICIKTGSNNLNSTLALVLNENEITGFTQLLAQAEKMFNSHAKIQADTTLPLFIRRMCRNELDELIVDVKADVDAAVTKWGIDKPTLEYLLTIVN